MLTKAEQELKAKIVYMLKLKEEIRAKTREWKKLRKEICDECDAWTTAQALDQLAHLIREEVK